MATAASPGARVARPPLRPRPPTPPHPRHPHTAERSADAGAATSATRRWQADHRDQRRGCAHHPVGGGLRQGRQPPRRTDRQAPGEQRAPPVAAAAARASLPRVFLRRLRARDGKKKSGAGGPSARYAHASPPLRAPRAAPRIAQGRVAQTVRVCPDVLARLATGAARAVRAQRLRGARASPVTRAFFFSEGFGIVRAAQAATPAARASAPRRARRRVWIGWAARVCADTDADADGSPRPLFFLLDRAW